MFIKLVVMILVCGSSGVGLLSVRQSRLQAAHEMAEARHRIRMLEEQAGELRAQIAQASTPDRIAELLANGQRYQHAVQHLALLRVFDEPGEPIVEPVIEPILESVAKPVIGSEDQESDGMALGDELHWVEDAPSGDQVWILNDGSRVLRISH